MKSERETKLLKIIEDALIQAAEYNWIIVNGEMLLTEIDNSLIGPPLWISVKTLKAGAVDVSSTPC